MHPTDNITSTLIFSGILLASSSAFAIFMIRRFRVLLAAAPSDRFSDVGKRMMGILRFFIGQGRILNPKYIGAGIMHAVIFWGFLAVMINSIHFIGRGFVTDWSLPLFGSGELLSNLYLPFVDLFEIGVLIMVIWAGIRRVIIKPIRVTNSWDAALILGLIGSLMLTDILIRGAEATVGESSPLGNSLAGLFSSMGIETVNFVFTVSWWLHLITLTFFIAYLPV